MADLEQADGLVTDAYRFLFKGGNWDQILLYHGREYTDACEKFFPKTCAMLKENLPKRAQHHYPWEGDRVGRIVRSRGRLPGVQGGPLHHDGSLYASRTHAGPLQRKRADALRRHSTGVARPLGEGRTVKSLRGLTSGPCQTSKIQD